MCDRLPWPRLVPRTSYGIKRSTPSTPEHGRTLDCGVWGVYCVRPVLSVCEVGWGGKAERFKVGVALVKFFWKNVSFFVLCKKTFCMIYLVWVWVFRLCRQHYTHDFRLKTMKTSTKTKTAIVIGELPSASNASNPLLVHSAAVVASVRGGLAWLEAYQPIPTHDIHCGCGLRLPFHLARSICGVTDSRR